MAIRWPWSKKSVFESAGGWELFRDAFVRASRSGAIVNEKTALEVTTAFACARVIIEGIAQVPFKIYQTQGESRREAVEHPAYWLLSKRPNDWQTSVEFREQIGLHLVLCGGAFVFVNRAGDGRPLELLPFLPGWVTVKRRDDMSIDYEVRIDGRAPQRIPAENMWHLRGPSWDGLNGLQVVKVAREALGLALATEEHSARMFGNGAKVGGVLSTEQTLKQDQVDALRQAWQDAQGGNSNAYKTAILYGGLKWSPMAMQNDQAELTETRRFQVEEVCRALRVMPIMVGHADKAVSYASAEQLFIAHVTHTLMPWYRRVEDSADVNILGMDAVKRGYYVKFNANALLRGSVAARGQFYREMYGIGALNPNEIRGLEDLNPYDGGEKYRVPLNMADPSADPMDPAHPGDPAADPAK